MIQRADSAELERIIGETQRQHFAVIPFPLSYRHVKNAADNYLDFVEYASLLPTEDKKLLHFNDPQDLNYGYFRRDGSEKTPDKRDENPDKKDVFHFTADLEQRVPGLYMSEDPRVKRFIESAELVYDATIGALKHLLDILAIRDPLAQEKFFQQGVTERCFLRFLKYDELEKGKTIARGHYDKGAITVAIAESTPGLRIGPKGAPIEVEHKDGSALFFAGKGFKETFKGIEVDPAWHDVIQKADAPYRPGVGRWTAVLFADALNQRMPDAIETHTYVKRNDY